jgi:hypothetical protein
MRNKVPFEEMFQRIAFLTRQKPKNGDVGAVYLNILQVDPYSETTNFELLTTKYEAEMDGGVRDDVIYKAFVMQVTSLRGIDVAFVCQYNDSIIFDCITSTKQNPIRFPMPSVMKDDEFEGVEWESNACMDICKGATPIKQTMQMDDSGAIYFAVRTENGLIKILRVDPKTEMGNQGFIKVIYSHRCQEVHFFHIRGKQFYLMDEKKKIRVFSQD